MWPDLGRNSVIRSLAIVTPMANERETAEAFLAEVATHTQAIPAVRHYVVLDTVSTDGTVGIVESLASHSPHVEFVWAPENRSVVDAYLTGYRAALDGGADWVLEIDAGFSHRPADIPKFLRTAQEGYDCVFGTRFALGGRLDNAPMSRRTLSRGGTLLAKALLDTKLSDLTSGFQLFRWEALAYILDQGIESRGPFFQTEMKAMTSGMRVAEVPIVYSSPSHSVSRDSISEALTNLWRLRQRQRTASRWSPEETRLQAPSTSRRSSLPYG